jgi:hypothetical protein
MVIAIFSSSASVVIVVETGAKRTSAAEEQAASKGARSGAVEAAMAREEVMLCTEGPAHRHRGAAPEAGPGAATKAAGDASNDPAVKAKKV